MKCILKKDCTIIEYNAAETTFIKSLPADVQQRIKRGLIDPYDVHCIPTTLCRTNGIATCDLTTKRSLKLVDAGSALRVAHIANSTIPTQHDLSREYDVYATKVIVERDTCSELHSVRELKRLLSKCDDIECIYIIGTGTLHDYSLIYTRSCGLIDYKYLLAE